MNAAGDLKNFLYSWLGKQKKMPEYTFTSLPSSKGTRFRAQVVAPGFAYTGVGESTNKKEAQTIAAADFCKFLVESGFVRAVQIPGLMAFPPHLNFSSKKPQPPPGLAPVLQHSNKKPATSAVQTMPEAVGLLKEPEARLNVERVPDSSALKVDASDLDPALHGFWTLENAKHRLHQYMQVHKIAADYKYLEKGPENKKEFFAEMTLYVKQIKTKIYACERGSTKQAASKACALSIVRQLFRHKVVEAFNGVAERKQTFKTPPYSIQLDNFIVERLKSTCSSFGLHSTPSAKMLESARLTRVNLVPETKESLYKASMAAPGLPVSWSPPLSAWNPWLSTPITEGKYAAMNMSQINGFLSEKYRLMTTEPAYQKKRAKAAILPVLKYKKEILEEIDRSQVVLVRGDPGSGKSTQIPQLILDSYLASGRGSECCILVAQPQRLAAVSAADRVASERFEPLGASCGFSVRFECQLPRPYGAMLFCTVDVLLKKLENGLRGVSHIIVDEVHERTLDMDLLLAVLKDMTKASKDVRIILMSASTDTASVSRYFDNCPVVEIAGESHSVQEYFLEDIVEMLGFVQPNEPAGARKRRMKEDGEVEDQEEDEEDDEDNSCLDDLAETKMEPNCNEMISAQYSQKTRDGMKSLSESAVSFELMMALISFITENQKQSGAILVFLPDLSSIDAFIKHLKRKDKFGNAKSSSFLLLPLHSQLPREDQYKVFAPAPEGRTKIVVSTGIAESAVTIDDVVYVIDSCRVKQRSRSHADSAVVFASKSNCAQRRGRAGRVRAGHYFCLVSKARYERLPDRSTPEISSAPLLEAELTVKLLNLGNAREFLARTVEPAPVDTVIKAEADLKAMNALDANGELTPLGRILARLPLEPRLGKMVVFGCLLNVGDSICTIVAASEFLTLFSDARHASQVESGPTERPSDQIATLRAFWRWLEFKQNSPNDEAAEHEFCERHHLRVQSLRMVHEARNQLKNILLMSGFPEECFTETTQLSDPEWQKGIFDAVASLLCYAFYSEVCYHDGKRHLSTAEGSKVNISRSSVNYRSRQSPAPLFKSPFFVVDAESKGNALSAKQLTMITPLQLLVFGSAKVESVPKCVPEQICVDNWIHLNVSHELAAQLLTLRLAFEKLLATYLSETSLSAETSESIQGLVDLIYKLSDQNGVDVKFKRIDENTAPPPPRSEPSQPDVCPKSVILKNAFISQEANPNGVVLPFWINKSPVANPVPPETAPQPSGSLPKKLALTVENEAKPVPVVPKPQQRYFTPAQQFKSAFKFGKTYQRPVYGRPRQPFQNAVRAHPNIRSENMPNQPTNSSFHTQSKFRSTHGQTSQKCFEKSRQSQNRPPNNNNNNYIKKCQPPSNFRLRRLCNNQKFFEKFSRN